MPKKVKRVIVTPDKHFPLHSKPAINVLIKTIHKVKPDAYVDLGDLGEWGSVSHWQWKKKKRPPLEYQMPAVDKDIEDVNAGLDIIDNALNEVKCTEKYMIEGNHDEWLDRFVEENPYLKGYKFKDALRLKERGYKYYENGKYLKLGKLYFYHGNHYGGMAHARNHLLRLGCNIMYGHHHDLQQSSVTHMDGPKSAWSIGCLKDMSSEANNFLGNRQTNWSHAFAIVDFFNNGYFTVHILQIINGITSLWGEIIDGN
mgnify:FL=1|jgi:predicted phosphodiesterase|tara:strand:- start:764 stop:1534 length:771 start_codon:yes stop_codon:yes gene_type:complete